MKKQKKKKRFNQFIWFYYENKETFIAGNTEETNIVKDGAV